MTGLPIQVNCGCSCTSQVVVCRCEHAQLISPETIAGFDDALNEVDVDVVYVDDLCRLAADRDVRLAGLSSSGSLHVVACYPRAVRWLLHAAGVPLEEKELVVYNLRSRPADDIVADLTNSTCMREEVAVSRIASRDNWLPWYPVIDYERCDNCGQCASFCIFGVYNTREDGGVEVAAPRNCKANCPACARICPQGAIVFPKIAESPINGDEITDESLIQANLQINVAEILGDDPRAALVARRAKAQRRLIRKNALATAEAERCACSDEASGKPLPCEVQTSAKPCCGGEQRS
ncbi:MAG: ferredoxin family protein [bacterium]|nr:ferredoxin family protein [bacterium]